MSEGMKLYEAQRSPVEAADAKVGEAGFSGVREPAHALRETVDDKLGPCYALHVDLPGVQDFGCIVLEVSERTVGWLASDSVAFCPPTRAPLPPSLPLPRVRAGALGGRAGDKASRGPDQGRSRGCVPGKVLHEETVAVTAPPFCLIWQGPRLKRGTVAGTR